MNGAEETQSSRVKILKCLGDGLSLLCRVLAVFIFVANAAVASGLSHGTYGSSGIGHGTCGGINQKACQPTGASFEGDAVGSCPAGTFFDLVNWGCWSCPEGFEREFTTAGVTSDRACQRQVKSGEARNPRHNSATFARNACDDNGAFFDHIDEGTCWTCPPGYVRSAASVKWNDACVIIPSENLKAATEHSKGTGLLATDCPSGQFWDMIDGKCHSCPPGYVRTGYSVHDSKACSKYVAGKTSKATLKGSASCAEGDFNDFLMSPEKGGACYSCPDGYDRTLFEGVNTAKACETTPELVFARANNEVDLTCPAGQIFDFTANNANSQVKALVNASGNAYDRNPDGGTCWSCPPGGYRSWEAIWSPRACMAASTNWIMPAYEQPGLFGLDGATEVVLKLLKDKKEINTIAESMAKNKELGMTKAEVLKDTWLTIHEEPAGSGPLLLAVYARLQEAALHPARGLEAEKRLLASFENAVKDYRVFHAEEALRAFRFWQAGAAYRYTHPDLLANPRSVAAMIFWASIGLPGPPDGPPDFSALTYEYLADELVMGASIDLATVEQLMSPDDFATLLPSDPAAEVAARFKAKVLDTVTGAPAGAVQRALEKRFIKQIYKATSKQATKAAMKSTGKLTATVIGKATGKATAAALGSVGPQIAIALATEFVDGWVSGLIGIFDGDQLLEVYLVDAKKDFSVKALIETGNFEGAAELKQQFRSIMAGYSAPNASDKGSIQTLALAGADYDVKKLCGDNKLVLENGELMCSLGCPAEGSVMVNDRCDNANAPKYVASVFASESDVRHFCATGSHYKQDDKKREKSCATCPLGYEKFGNWDGSINKTTSTNGRYGECVFKQEPSLAPPNL